MFDITIATSIGFIIVIGLYCRSNLSYETNGIFRTSQNKLTKSLNNMLQCDNVYDKHVQWPVSSWSVVGEVTPPPPKKKKAYLRTQRRYR